MLSALLLAGCAAAPVTEAGVLQLDYKCAHSRVLPVARAADGQMVTARIDGKDVKLTRVDRAAQEAKYRDRRLIPAEEYSDGRYALYLDSDRAMMEEDGKVLYGPCVSPVPVPVAPRR